MIVKISGMKLAGLCTVKEIGMEKEKIRKLQNHFNNGIKEGIQAKVHYQNGDRVHLKGTNVNGTVIAVIFKDDRKYPYLKIKWDTTPCEPGKAKLLYDPFDVVKELSSFWFSENPISAYRKFIISWVRIIEIIPAPSSFALSITSIPANCPALVMFVRLISPA